MKILLEKNMPNGAQASEHTIETLTIQDAYAVAIITSRTSAGAMAWQEPVEIDISDLTGDPLASAATALMKAGGYLEGGVIAADQTPEDVLRLTLLKRVDRIREKKVEGGCVTGLGRVQSDEVSIRNLLGAVQTATLAQMTNLPFEMAWRMEDNTLVNVNAPEMIALGMKVMEHVQHCYQISWEIKDFLNEATIEEIEGIDLEFEWNRIAAE